MDDRWSTWQAEAAGTNRLPSASSALALFAIVAALLWALLAAPGSTAQGGDSPATTPPPCAQHWPPTCQEATRGP
jgi:hypothetical protein